MAGTMHTSVAVDLLQWGHDKIVMEVGPAYYESWPI